MIEDALLARKKRTGRPPGSRLRVGAKCLVQAVDAVFDRHAEGLGQGLHIGDQRIQIDRAARLVGAVLNSKKLSPPVAMKLLQVTV